MIQFVSHLRQVGGFLRSTPVSATFKTDRYDITEILLKVTLSTIVLTLTHLDKGYFVWTIINVCSKSCTLMPFLTYYQHEYFITLFTQYLLFNLMWTENIKWIITNCLPAPHLWQFLPNCRECGGTRQSPVNIRSKDVIRTKNIPPFDFRDLRNTRDVKMTMLNDGRRGECLFDFLEILVTMTFTVTLVINRYALI